MAKKHFIKKGKFKTSHEGVSLGKCFTCFKFSANKDGHVTILATYDKGKSHIEIKHEIMDCSVKYLVSWLQEQVVKLGKGV